MGVIDGGVYGLVKRVEFNWGRLMQLFMVKIHLLRTKNVYE